MPITLKKTLPFHFPDSGYIDLAKKTGAKIIYGPTAKAEYEITVAKDEQFFPLGNVKIQVLHTPGHTLESSCFLLYDDHNIPYACFTGDTLFVGEVGRRCHAPECK